MDVVSWLKENIKFEDLPVEGSTFISPEGKFVDFKSAGLDHLGFMKKMIRMGVLNESVLNDENIPGLQDKGWIRCNTGISGEYPYIELPEKKPNWDQLSSIVSWIDFVLAKKKKVTVIWMTNLEYEEEVYPNTISGEKILDSILKVYRVGKFIPASALEAIKDKKKLNKKEALERAKEVYNMARTTEFSQEQLDSIQVEKVFVDDEIGNEHWEHYNFISKVDGSYVCCDNEEGYARLKWMIGHGVVPQKAQSDHRVCSIGFSEKEQKWYGWSHRARYGFEIGHKCKKGDCGVALKSEKIKSPVDYPEPGFTCKTLEDCKKVAIAFADSVS